MLATDTLEPARINLRASQEAKATIERAAALRGTAFMLQNAYEAARRIVADHDTLLLSPRDFAAFTATLESPPEPNEALRSLMAVLNHV